MGNFSTLANLLKGKSFASLDEEQNENSGVEVAPEGEDEGDGADTSGNGDGDEADDAGTSGNDGGEGAGEEVEGEGEGSGDPADAPAAQAVDVKSASYAAGFAAANDRWAGMLLNANCRSNMDLAVNLLTTTDLSAEQIGHACSLSAVDPAARKLLESTPKVNVAPNGDGTDAKPDAGKAARNAAVERVNNRRSGAKKKGS